MADDDQRASPTSANGVETVERSGVVQQGPEVPGRLAVPIASDRRPTRVVSTLLGHDNVQHVIGDVAKAKHRVSIIDFSFFNIRGQKNKICSPYLVIKVH